MIIKAVKYKRKFMKHPEAAEQYQLTKIQMYIKVGIIIQQRHFKCIKEVPQ